MATEELDILMITETKPDDSLPVFQFLIQGFCTLFRLDQNTMVAEFFFISEASTSTKLNRYIIKNLIADFFMDIQELEIVCSFFVVHIIQINWKLHPTFNKYLMELMFIAISIKIY